MKHTTKYDDRRYDSSANSAKLKLPDIYSLTADIICGLPIAAGYPPFPERYRVVADSYGRRRLLIESNGGVVRYVDDVALVNAILNYWRDQLVPLNPRFNLVHRNAVEAAKYAFEVLRPLTGEPPLIAFKSAEGLTFYRLPFDPIRSAPLDVCPGFKEIGDRMSNFPAFCMRVASLFDPYADRKQAVYVHGPKDSGKSQLQAILAFLAGGSGVHSSAYCVLGSAELNSPFWKSALVGKRLLVLPEASPNFLPTSEFKSLTGDGLHAINQKNRPIFMAMLPVLVFLFSNGKPLTRGDSAVIERIIDCEIRPFQRSRMIPEREYQEQLRRELPAFIGYCLELYAPYCGGRRLPCDLRNINAGGDDLSEEAVSFFEEHLSVDKVSTIMRDDFYEMVRDLAPHCSTKKYRLWIKIWKKKFGLGTTRPSACESRNGSSKRPTYITGVRFRKAIDSNPVA